MSRFAGIVLWMLAAGTCFGQTPAILQRGPLQVASIPLKPVQIVDAWKGTYSYRSAPVWVYATQSPDFILSGPSVTLGNFTFKTGRAQDEMGTAYKGWILPAANLREWTLIFFFVDEEKESLVRAWISAFVKDFRSLQSLPEKRAPVVFPSVLLEK